MNIVQHEVQNIVTSRKDFLLKLYDYQDKARSVAVDVAAMVSKSRDDHLQWWLVIILVLTLLC